MSLEVRRKGGFRAAPFRLGGVRGGLSRSAPAHEAEAREANAIIAHVEGSGTPEPRLNSNALLVEENDTCVKALRPVIVTHWLSAEGFGCLYPTLLASPNPRPLAYSHRR